MAQIFSPRANRIPFYAGLVLLLAMPGALLAAWYYFSPRFMDAGYMPRQPVPFSHRLHAGELKIDCRYCHTQVEVSSFASIPQTKICMNCHKLVSRKSPRLALVRESAGSGEPLHWIRVHKLPEFVYFDHSIHIRAGVRCSTCHGDVERMDEIHQVQPLSMTWCLDCHRHPPALSGGRVTPSTDCSACHR